ncbi:MAG: hypothetical protein N3A72_07305 [bacterium]|nr:hypothetical protein [bacterium]
MIFQVIIAIIIFLIGFYCGKIWVTKLAGKTISFSLRSALTVIFLILVAIIIIGSIIFSYRPQAGEEPISTPEQVAPPVK